MTSNIGSYGSIVFGKLRHYPNPPGLISAKAMYQDQGKTCSFFVIIDQNEGGFTSLGVFVFDTTARVELSSNCVEF